MIRELNRELVDDSTFAKKVMGIFESLEDDAYVPELIVENIINLRADVRRYIINHDHVSQAMAYTLAQIFVIAEELEKELKKNTKYKEPALKNMMEKILKVSSELATAQESTHPRMIDAIRHAIDKLEGNKDKIDTITSTFERIFTRLEASDSAMKIKAMKLASLIMQSNKDKKKRREVIDQL